LAELCQFGRAEPKQNAKDVAHYCRCRTPETVRQVRTLIISPNAHAHAHKSPREVGMGELFANSEQKRVLVKEPFVTDSAARSRTKNRSLRTVPRVCGQGSVRPLSNSQGICRCDRCKRPTALTLPCLCAHVLLCNLADLLHYLRCHDHITTRITVVMRTPGWRYYRHSPTRRYHSRLQSVANHHCRMTIETPPLAVCLW
jgi:hypothetical protein